MFNVSVDNSKKDSMDKKKIKDKTVELFILSFFFKSSLIRLSHTAGLLVIFSLLKNRCNLQKIKQSIPADALFSGKLWITDKLH